MLVLLVGRICTYEAQVRIDEDSERARTLIELYESRGRIGDLPMAGLRKSRERIAAIAKKYAQADHSNLKPEHAL